MFLPVDLGPYQLVDGGLLNNVPVEMRLKTSPPDLVLRPELPGDLDLLLSFDRLVVPIVAEEKVANDALPGILKLIQGEKAPAKGHI